MSQPALKPWCPPVSGSFNPTGISDLSVNPHLSTPKSWKDTFFFFAEERGERFFPSSIFTGEPGHTAALALELALGSLDVPSTLMPTRVPHCVLACQEGQQHLG